MRLARPARQPMLELRLALFVFALAAILAVAATKVLDVFRLAMGEP